MYLLRNYVPDYIHFYIILFFLGFYHGVLITQNIYCFNYNQEHNFLKDTSYHNMNILKYI